MSYLRNVLSVKCPFEAKVLKDGGTDPEKTISYLDETITGTKDTWEQVQELWVFLEAHHRVEPWKKHVVWERGHLPQE